MSESKPQSVPVEPWLTAKEPLTENERAIIAEVIERGDNPVELRRWLRLVIRTHDSLVEQLQTAERERDGLHLENDERGARINDLLEQLQAERREEWREGIVNVLDHEGNYLGCMGSETWAWTLDGGIERMKEQLEAAREAALELREHMAYDEYGFVRAAVEHILGNHEEWGRWQHSNPASIHKTGPAEGGAALARRRGGTGWSQVAEAPEADTSTELIAGETDSSRQGQNTSNQERES